MLRRSLLVLLAVALVAACARHVPKPAATQFSVCDAASQRDATYIFGVSLVPRHHLTKPPHVVYFVEAPAGAAYMTYVASSSGCSLTHLDARWEHHGVPLVFHLRGGRLRSVTLKRKAAHAELVVVDSFGRASTTALTRALPVGLTLWEETGTDLLHAALATRWQSEAGADIVVGRDGPELFPSEEQATPPPVEWDVQRRAYVRRISVYKP
ncbi:MAG: hypothetical protein JO343_06375 [Candidatus Eremiobacteraeota bacterium]|nr:hypothetical protein [Candidatus Eremiobacteraeota bacterium]